MSSLVLDLINHQKIIHPICSWVDKSCLEACFCSQITDWLKNPDSNPAFCHRTEHPLPNINKFGSGNRGRGKLPASNGWKLALIVGHMKAPDNLLQRKNGFVLPSTLHNCSLLCMARSRLAMNNSCWSPHVFCRHIPLAVFTWYLYAVRHFQPSTRKCVCAGSLFKTQRAVVPSPS